MTNRPRNPQPDPSPASKEPRDDRPSEVGVSEVSYYGSIMPREQRKVLKEAGMVKDLEQELELLRYRLRGLLINKSDKDYLIFKAVELIIRAYAAKNRASGNSPDDAAEGVATLFKDVAQELGMDLIPRKTNA